MLLGKLEAVMGGIGAVAGGLPGSAAVIRGLLEDVMAAVKGGLPGGLLGGLLGGSVPVLGGRALLGKSVAANGVIVICFLDR